MTTPPEQVIQQQYGCRLAPEEMAATYLPTPGQIRAACERLRRDWTPAERARRNQHPNPEAELQEVGRASAPIGFAGFTSDQIGANH